jgi:APA family basic amino acid/polyamine antiporter
MTTPPSAGKATSQKTVFVREATGLVRRASFLDTFVWNSSAAWYGSLVTFAIASLLWIPGGDFPAAVLVAIVLAVFIGVTYAGLTASMPRSGGDYVFNSRILHPSVGFGLNFSLSFWQLFSVAFVLFTLTSFYLAPSLQVLGYFTGSATISNFAAWSYGSSAVLIVATIVNMIFLALALFGTKTTLRFLDIAWIVSTIAVVSIIVVLATTPQATFANEFNKMMASYAGPVGNTANPYQTTITTAASNGYAVPPYRLVAPDVAAVAGGVIWTFWSTYISGEVKHARDYRRNLTTMVGAAVMNGLLLGLLLFLAFRAFGYAFVSSAGYLSSGTTSPLPFSLYGAFAFLAALASQNVLLTGLIVVGSILGAFIILPSLIYQPVRSMFAWSIDRLIPSRLSSVNDRFHVPVLLHLLAFAIIEAMIFAFNYFSTPLIALFSASIIGPAFSSMFPTGISAMIFPFRRKEVFQSSPANQKVGGVPVISIFGALCVASIIFLLYEFVSWSGFGIASPSFDYFAIGVVLFGIVLYFIIRAVQARRNVSIELAFREIPPE